MTDLLVIGCDSADAAKAARADLFKLSRECDADIGDAVVASADAKGRILLNQAVTAWVVGTASGLFLGVLIGVLFLHPLLGVVAGAGAVTDALSDFGIKDDFMKDVERVLEPGHAALFVLARTVKTDRIIEHLADQGGEVLRTNLSHADDDKLSAAFASAQKHALAA